MCCIVPNYTLALYQKAMIMEAIKRKTGFLPTCQNPLINRLPKSIAMNFKILKP